MTTQGSSISPRKWSHAKLCPEWRLESPLEFFFKEQSYSSLHSVRSLARDHVRSDIDDPCGAIADFCGVITDPQSAEYDKRVANISLFVYIGSSGLHRNNRQAPGSSRQAPGSSRHSVLAYIYNIYRLSVHNFNFSIERTSLFFDIFGNTHGNSKIEIRQWNKGRR